MPTNQQRREAERRRLQRQLEQRRAKEAARKRATLIGSIVGTLVVIAAVVIIVIVATGGSDKKKDTGSGGDPASPSPTPTTSATSSAAPPVSTPTAPCAAPGKGKSAAYKGVTVGEATDLKQAPKVAAKGTATPATLECQDLVVGTGKTATPTSTVSVQYTGVLYANGKEFDSSWTNGGKPVQFPLTGVVPGFTQGIGGAGKVAPMRVGGRRVMILPAALGYPDGNGSSIPAGSALVFVVDLKSIDG